MAQTVSLSEWQRARAQLEKEEEEAFKVLDSIVAKRRQLPMIEIEDPSQIMFQGPSDTQASLVDLFDGRRQLIVYNFMLYDKVEDPCQWCSFNMDNIPSHLQHLHSRETSFVVMAPASLEKIVKTKERMGWQFPFYSATNTVVRPKAIDADDMPWNPSGNFTGYACFIREGSKVYLTYIATDRGTEAPMVTIALLDMTKLGRQEEDGDRPFPLRK